MHKLLLLFLLSFSVLIAGEYPDTFAKLGTPLYKSIKPLSKYSDMELFENKILTYTNQANRMILDGFKVDKSKDKAKIKEYLFGLRKLEKDHDFLIHLLHNSINKAIDSNDYKLFIKLTSYEFNGLLKSTNLRSKSIAFYDKNRAKKRSKFLDKKINHDKLIEETTQEFYNQSIKAVYDSNAKNENSTRTVLIETKRTGNIIYVSFKNKNIFDVTIKVKSNYKNIIERHNTPKVFVVKAGSSVEYTTLKMGVGSTSYQYGYSWIIGDKDAIHDDTYLYRLPYAVGTSHVVSQGFNGKFTHKGSSKYSIDFVMPVGTKVYASREGIVVKTKEDSNVGGASKEFSRDGNFITIAHSDGTLATYYHLKQRGVIVKIGDKVHRGTHIGYSGNTGYSSGPHLHLSIFKAIGSIATTTVPIKLIATTGVVNEPQKGTFYQSK